MSIFETKSNIAINIAKLWMYGPLYCYKVCFAKVDIALDEGAPPPSKEAVSPSNLSIFRAWTGGGGIVSPTQSNQTILGCDEVVVQVYFKSIHFFPKPLSTGVPFQIFFSLYVFVPFYTGL